MRGVNLIYLSLVVFAAISNIADGYKILGVFQTVSKSHFIIGNALMSGLAAKGHDVTVISPYPMRDKNYKAIEVPSAERAVHAAFGDFLEMRDITLIESLLQIYDMGIIMTNATLSEPGVKRLIASKEKFDVIVMDLFVSEALFGLSEVFDAPLIVTGLFGALSWNTDLVGTPSPLSYVPHPFTDLTHRMNLFERISNIVATSLDTILFNYFYLPRQEELFALHFPGAKKSLQELRKGTSLVLLNQHVSLSYPRPYLPNMVEVGGLHINHERKPLPSEMQTFMDNAKDGVIYFSLGSNIKSSNLPAEKRDAILRTFKSLKQRVMWKFEDANLPGKSGNVFISDWFPQDDVLAHPNVKLFITHGGLLSTMESIYHGKPFLGIPIFGDQFLNMAQAEANGFGLTVDYNLLSEDTFKAAITEMLANPKYTQLIRETSKRFHDQPVEPLELAIYWVEYIARHKGAKHLYCASQELSFIQYHNIDAFAILLAVPVFLIYLVIKLISKLMASSKGSTKVKSN